MNRPLAASSPQVIGRYELVAPIATGALGDLFRARIISGPEEGRVVAVRRIPRTEALDATAVERINNAGFAAMELRHPKIAAVLDVVMAETDILVVSEHIGGSLLQMLVRPPSGKRPLVPVPVALRLALDALEAVNAVRAPWSEIFADADSEDERRLATGVHGGLMPDELLIASFGETMLFEAGLAGTALTVPSILNNPDVIAYRAPEQLEGAGPIDERADIFSIGILLWELIAGRALFGSALLPRPTAGTTKPKGVSDSLQVSAARRKVLTAPIQRLDAIPLLKGKVSKELADFVARCLERNRSARYASTQEAIDAIKRVGTVGPHEAVAKLLSSVVGAEEEDQERISKAPESNRPTVPPEDSRLADADTERDRAPDGATPSAPSTEPDTTKEAGLAAADLESIPPSSADFGSVMESLPPSGEPKKVLTAQGETEASITMMSAVPGDIDLTALTPLEADPPSSEGLPPLGDDPPPQAGSFAFPKPPPPRRQDRPDVQETTSAPVVRALPSGASDSSSSGPVPEAKSGRGQQTRIVVAVIAAAALLLVIAALRAIFSGGSSEPETTTRPAAASTGTPAAASVTVPSPEVPSPPATTEAVVEPAAPVATTAPAGALPAAAPAPTLAPHPEAQIAAPLPKLPKKKPFRPTGI